MMTTTLSRSGPSDERYLDLIRNALRVCRSYKPAFGLGKGDGISLERFQQVYQEDEFYSWFGLDSPLVYAAHKAAGGMTSVYRQIGLGCQLVFQIPSNLADRYQRAQWLLLRGTVNRKTTDSTYVFCRETLGYDLAGFFRRNSSAIKDETLAVFEGLLR
jgi:hypothetical protein